jgi:uncharacterized membrane protein
MTLTELGHLHLQLNHFPTVGTIVGLGLLLLALAKRSEDLLRASLAVLFVIALMALPAYMTGHAAQRVVIDRPGVSEAMIARHQSAALLALILMELTGVVAWIGLWRTWRGTRRAGWAAPVTLLLATATLVLMASAATIGGAIGHEEIRGTMASAAGSGTALAPSWLTVAWISEFFFDEPMAWPVAEIAHFIGLALLFGVVLAGSLRLMGILQHVPLGAVHRLLAWGAAAFVLQGVTGMAFFVGQANQYIDNPAFQWKVLLILVAGANVLYLTLFDNIWDRGANEEVPLRAKLLGASQMVLWIGVIYYGRMLPYLGNAF